MDIASVVDTVPTFQLREGGDIRLPCYFEEEPLVAIWAKENSSHQELTTRKASFFNGNFISKEDRFDMDGNFSLVITDLQTADEGRYHCQIVLRDFEVFSNSTFLTVSTGKYNSLGLIIGLVIGVTGALVTLFFLVGKILQKYHPDYLPRKGCDWNPCWRRPPEGEPTEEEIELMIDSRNRRDELRQKIKDYKPGRARYEKDFENPSKVNISFFGEIAAGKSCLINSLNFALNGQYSIVTKEGVGEDGGRMTRRRFHHILAERIDLIDTCGIQDLSSKTLERLKEECNGIFRAISKTRVKRKEEECHCAVFVYRQRPDAEKDGKNFIKTFCNMVKRYLGTEPLVVITHKKDYADPEAVCHEISGSAGKRKIWMFENYTPMSDDEDIEKDVEYLKFLWSALQTCDETIYHRKKKIL
ncbi:uncharacterized protein [Diadema setosum]|uniref:uncharacterized protein n=1 Tax=Diadema setosum TaxID=31175 RepID=UPI003B3AD948